MSMVRNVLGLSDKIETWLVPAFDLAIRLYVAKIFLLSGLTKIKSWSTTLDLFAYEYAVPVIPSKIAAFMATGAELVLPALLIVGLFSRPAALGLFILNYVAMISYPDISPAGIKDHWLWGALLLVTFFHGPGKLSLDFWIRRWLTNR